MSDEANPDRALVTRIARTVILLGVLIIINGLWGMASTWNRSADDEVLAQQNAEIDSRLTEANSLVAEVKQLRQQTNDLNEKAAKIEATLGRSASNNK
jgi:cell division protein FtsB